MTEEKKQDQLSFELGEKSDREEAPTKAERTSDGETLAWTCHPAKQNRTKTIIVSVFIVVVVVAVYLWTYSVFLTILSALILTGSLAAYYFPTSYEFTEEAIIIKTTMQKLTKKWSQYRSCYPDKNGVLLSPFVRPSRLENFRGIYIRFSDNKEAVIAYAKRKIDEVRAEEFGEGS